MQVLEFGAFSAKLKKSLQLAEFKSFSGLNMLPFRQFSELQLFLRRVVTGEVANASLGTQLIAVEFD